MWQLGTDKGLSKFTLKVGIWHSLTSPRIVHRCVLEAWRLV